jgi:hypothetical protein
LGIELETGTRVIAKMYRKDRAPRHARVLADLGAALAGATRVPRLLDCWEDMGLVLQEWVPGAPVPDYEHLAGEAALVERLAAALAALHAAPLATERRSDLAAHVRRTCGAGLDSLGAEWPQMAAMAYELEGAIYARETRMACNLRPCHGDFAPRRSSSVRSTSTSSTWMDCQLQRSGFDIASLRVGLEALGKSARAGGSIPGGVLGKSRPRCAADADAPRGFLRSAPGAHRLAQAAAELGRRAAHLLGTRPRAVVAQRRDGSGTRDGKGPHDG